MNLEIMETNEFYPFHFSVLWAYSVVMAVIFQMISVFSKLGK